MATAERQFIRDLVAGDVAAANEFVNFWHPQIKTWIAGSVPLFKLEDIAIVSCRGMQSTAMADVAKIGKHKIRKFTGNYDANAEQIYTDGELNFDTIFRYKGQQAPVVILVDLDETLERNDWATGVLYCAMTRATVRLELVVQKDCPWIDVFQENLDDG